MDFKMNQSEGRDISNVNIELNSDGGDSTALKSMCMDAGSENRVGLTKEELMKYANQPFWVRLRNIMFASFWIIWVSILVAAIGYVVNSPGCTKLASAANVTAPAGSAGNSG